MRTASRMLLLGSLLLSLSTTARAQAPVAGQPYQIPAGYEGYGAGTLIAYGGYNYVIQSNRTMLLAASSQTYQPTQYTYQQPQYTYQQPQYTYQPTQYTYPTGGLTGVADGRTLGNSNVAISVDRNGQQHRVPVNPGMQGGGLSGFGNMFGPGSPW